MELGFSSHEALGTESAGAAASGMVRRLLGSFGRHLAPAHHHDRCDRSVQMRLYSFHKRQYLGLLVGVLFSIATSLLMGSSGPAMTVQSRLRASTLQPPVTAGQMATGPFVLLSPPLTSFSRHLTLCFTPIFATQHDEVFDKNFSFSVDIEGVTENAKHLGVFQEDSLFNRSRNLHCAADGCDSVTLLRLSHVTFRHYVFVLRLHHLASLHQRYNITDLHFTFTSINADFTRLQMWLQFVFLVVSFFAMIGFVMSLRRCFPRDWSLEQKWTCALLFGLVCYNDPLFSACLLAANSACDSVHSLIEQSFVSALLFYWLCLLHGLRQTVRSWLKFYVPKVTVVGCLWLLMVVLVTWRQHGVANDPTFFWTDYDTLAAADTCFYIVLLAYIIYLLILVVRGYSELRSMSYLCARFTFSVTAGVLLTAGWLCVAVRRLTLRRVSVTPSAALLAEHSGAADMLTVAGMVNSYVVTAAYVFAPLSTSRGGAADCQLVKDNPGESMMNDSDEDVLYGSDEGSRLPLHSVKTDHDSD